MAVVVLNFIPKGKTAKAQAKETLGYNGTRPGKDEEEIDRTLFGHGGEYTSEQALQMIDEAPPNTYFWRIIVSPDPNSENKDKNLDLWLLTTQLVAWLEGRLNREIPFIGAEHDDHTNIPHIHAIALIQRRGREMLVDRETIYALIEYATQMSLQQQQDLTEKIELLPTPAVQKEKGNFIFLSAGMADRKAKHIYTPKPSKQMQQPTQSCGNCQARQSVVELKSGVRWCTMCKKVQRKKQLNSDRKQGLQLGL
jgi:hypothetical protein